MKLFLPVLLALTSCELTEEATVDDINKLIKTWVVETVYIDDFEDIANDYSNWQLEIQEGNSYVFTDIEGNSETGTWEITDNNSVLTVNPDNGTSRDYYVLELTESSLKLIRSESGLKDVNVDFRYELVPL